MININKFFKIILIILYIFYSIFVYSDDYNNQIKLNKLSYALAVIKAAPAVVSIQTTQDIPLNIHPMFNDPIFKFFFNNPDKSKEKLLPNKKQIQQGLGSGVIVDNRGYVLTNNHVIKDANSVIIRCSNGLTSEVEVIGSDPRTDLAILKIKDISVLYGLPVISLGSYEALCVGDVVLAIGNPFGFDNTVTQGIISGLGSLSARSGEQQVSLGWWLDNLIQTDAAINPGNSGGALIDVYGNLVGINIAIISKSGGSQGIGFAVPISLAKSIMDQLIDVGHIIRGWFGLQLGDLTQDIKNYVGFDGDHGVYVKAVIKDGPAYITGILPGDIILKINDFTVKSVVDAIKFVSLLKPDEDYTVEIFRHFCIFFYSVSSGKSPKGY